MGGMIRRGVTGRVRVRKAAGPENLVAERLSRLAGLLHCAVRGTVEARRSQQPPPGLHTNLFDACSGVLRSSERWAGPCRGLPATGAVSAPTRSAGDGLNPRARYLLMIHPFRNAPTHVVAGSTPSPVAGVGWLSLLVREP